ncbi:MYND-type domain-containing protein [Mycena indigotica]|uniref:MYND-type domain-containing protein n=1 Tax=Mycena indigotica TaxID=2126181 RepID=A0A8H6VUX7_9AGAR|nr:MYND-type domain-containing protein [Mycena indigotica]KAF7289179.1 MYND-type domain-containing protein [Mycena indigotica]
MHPSLEISVMLELGEPLRTTAIEAARGNMDELDTLVSIVCDDEMEWTQYALRGVSPAFYSTLDPKEIPLIRTQLDTLDPEWVATVLRRVAWTFRCLEVLMNGDILPSGAFSDIWQRVWAWTQFFDEFYSMGLPFPVMYEDPPMQPVDQIFSIAMNLFNRVWQRIEEHPEEPGLARLVSDDFAPKVLVVVGRVWSRLLRLKDDLGLYHISMIVLMERLGEQRDHSRSRRRLNELGFGTGGSWSDLATTMVGHILRGSAGRGPKNPLSHDDCQLIYSMVTLSWLLPRETDLRDALYEEGYAAALTTAFSALVNTPAIPSPFQFLVDEVFRLLVATFEYRASFQQRIAQAIRGGVLKLLFDYAKMGGNNLKKDALIRQVLTEDLPRATLYRSVLIRLPKALSRIKPLANTELVKPWSELTALIQERLVLLNEYENDDLTSQRGCDNVQCGLITHKTSLRRCAGCLVVYYCSRACQKVDWREGNHRNKCESFSSRVEHDYAHAVPRDWSFIRYLINRRYQQLRETIALRYLRLLFNARGPRQNLSPSPLLAVWFDIAQAPGQIKVRIELLGSNSESAGHGYLLTEEAACVRRSHGRLRLHVLTMACPSAEPEEGMKCIRFFPLRCKDSKMEDGLRGILNQIPPRAGEEELDVEYHRPRVQALLATLGLETH